MTLADTCCKAENKSVRDDVFEIQSFHTDWWKLAFVKTHKISAYTYRWYCKIVHKKMGTISNWNYLSNIRLFCVPAPCGVGSDPSCLWVRGGLHPRQLGQRQTTMHTHGQLRIANYPNNDQLDWRRKLECTQENTNATLHDSRESNLEPSCCEATVLTITSPCCPIKRTSDKKIQKTKISDDTI